jgi:NADPH-dependent 7-cyano-7-deazaguanine reductase QueF
MEDNKLLHEITVSFKYAGLKNINEINPLNLYFKTYQEVYKFIDDDEYKIQILKINDKKT